MHAENMSGPRVCGPRSIQSVYMLDSKDLLVTPQLLAANILLCYRAKVLFTHRTSTHVWCIYGTYVNGRQRTSPSKVLRWRAARRHHTCKL